MAANWQRGVLMAMGVKNHPVEVVGITEITSWYRRIRLSAPGFLDELAVHPTLWIRLWVPAIGKDKVVQRGYTLVDADPESGQFSLDFVLHEPTGPAASWAKNATIGTTAEIAHTPQKLPLDPDLQTLVLAGDATALPAIVSLLRSAPAEASKYVVIQDSHHDREAIDIPQDARTTLSWASGDPSGAGLVDALKASVPLDGFDPERAYRWAAGERKLVKAVREHARGPLGLGRHRQHAQNYWIAGLSAG